MYILKTSVASLLQAESIFLRFVLIFYDLFCTTLRLGTEVHPSPSFLGNVGYRSTLETLILVDFGPPLRAQNGRNRYPTLPGIFRGPATVSAEVKAVLLLYCKPPSHLRLQQVVMDLQIQFLPIQLASVLSPPHLCSISALQQPLTSILWHVISL